jgi:FKBP-type peptidyl-prolyl cis-trans isomerase FkpA
MIRLSVIGVFLLTLFISCENEEKDELVSWTKDDSIEMNTEFSEEEEYYIQQYLKRRPNWKMVETGTGLRYMIYSQGDGDSAVRSYYAKVDYKVSLLTDEVLYSSEETGPSTFKIDFSEVESGLQEGIKRMRVGDKGIFIIPSHLAHGLIGDMNKIPPLETIIMDIHFISQSK